MSDLHYRQILLGLLKLFVGFLIAALLFVLFDFMIDLRPRTIHSSYQFSLKNLEPDTPIILQQDNLAILLIKRSESSITKLMQSDERLIDPDSRDSRQPEFAQNRLRSRHPEFFVAYGRGTDFGCLLEAVGDKLKEICGRASYDYAGRALNSDGLNSDGRHSNLQIPDYEFKNDFTLLTIKP